jgi:hypothetical protein
MKTLLKVVFLGILCNCQFSTAQQIGSLDMTTTTPKARARYPEGVGGGSCVGREYANYPEAAVNLVSLDNTQYSLGENIVYEVNIKNIGKQTIVLPWDPALGDFEPQNEFAAYSYRKGTISLHFTVGKQDLAVYSDFYGSSAIPGTLKELQPGEWVVIRGRVPLVTYSDSISKELGKSDFLAAQVDADFMVNEVKFTPKGINGKPTETSVCAIIRTQRMNQLKATIFPSSNLQ